VSNDDASRAADSAPECAWALAADGAAGLNAWVGRDEAFHRAMIAACGSRRLLRVREGRHGQCEGCRRASVCLRRGVRDLGADHGAIAEGVLARDADLAVARTRAHCAATVGHLWQGPGGAARKVPRRRPRGGVGAG